MTKSPTKPDSNARRDARRTALIVGMIATAIYLGAILEVVLKR